MRQSILILCFAVFTISIFSQDRDSKYSKVRVFYNNDEQLDVLVSNGLSLRKGIHKKNVFIENILSVYDLKRIERLGYNTEIIIDDVQSFYVDRNRSSIKKMGAKSSHKGIKYPKPKNYNYGSMGGMLTYGEVLKELDDMATLYPNLITSRAEISTFSTFEGRKLHWIRMSDNPNVNESEPEILYTAIHHAREPMSIQQLVYYMWYMLENYATNDEVKAILDNTELYFIPFVNPDGYVYNQTTYPSGGGMWRKNRRKHPDGNYGVDLNRNYDYKDPQNGNIWGTTGISKQTNSDIYCGSSAFSEPESSAVKWFVNQHDFKIVLNNHSYSDVLLFPFGYEVGKKSPDHDTFVALANSMTDQNSMKGMIASGMYAASGDADDWMYGETTNHDKIFAFTPEIGNMTQGFWPHVSDIDAICESMIYLNLSAAHIAYQFVRIKDLQKDAIEEVSGFLKYNVQSVGLNTTSNVKVSITSISDNIKSIGSFKEYSNLEFLQTVLDSVSYAFDTSIKIGDEVAYIISIEQNNYVIRDTIKKLYGKFRTTFSDDAKNIDNWSSSNGWGVTNASYHSAPTSISDSPNGDYSANQNNTITLKQSISLIDVKSAQFTFWAKWIVETNMDYVQFEISTDGGTSWTPLYGELTSIGSKYQDEGNPLYHGVQLEWVKETIDLNAYLGKTILLQFQIVTDSEAQGDGFYFDDCELAILSEKRTKITYSHDGTNGVLKQNIPNPCDVSTVIYLDNFVISSNTILNVVNAMGQIVFRQEIKGSQNVVEVSTQSLNPGVYYYYVDIDGRRTETKKMLVVR